MDENNTYIHNFISCIIPSSKSKRRRLISLVAVTTILATAIFLFSSSSYSPYNYFSSSGTFSWIFPNSNSTSASPNSTSSNVTPPPISESVRNLNWPPPSPMSSFSTFTSKQITDVSNTSSRPSPASIPRPLISESVRNLNWPPPPAPPTSSVSNSTLSIPNMPVSVSNTNLKISSPPLAPPVSIPPPTPMSFVLNATLSIPNMPVSVSNTSLKISSPPMAPPVSIPPPVISKSIQNLNWSPSSPPPPPPSECDLFDGRWVRDEGASFYKGGECPYIDVDFDCYRNGRPDDRFLKWRWKPYGCDIPRMNATDFLTRLRGQRLIFVGDSLNRNMWESLVCILRHSIKNKKRVYEVSGKSHFKTKGYYSFRFDDYQCNVDFVRSPFLVKELFYKNKNGLEDEKLRLDILDETTTAYHKANIIVFNTGHWWTHEKTSKGVEYYQEGNYIYPTLKVMEAYKKALTTWAKWVDKNIDASKTQVVFRGYSLTHFKGGQWNSGGQCHKETEPIFNQTYLTKYPAKMSVFEEILKQMKTPIIYLNISRLTDYRKDGHPSIYRKKYKSVQEQIDAVRSQDCSHWCLPGIPDSWNELLYASLLMTGKGSWKR